jgi:glucose-1-phosphate thymidylyltransferase
MKGVILSGGKGSRLAPITDDYPKQLLPIMGKPVLFHCIDYLNATGISDICIVLSPHTGKIIEKTIEEAKLDSNITFIYQDEPRGLAHAIGITRDYVKDSDFLVLLGDNLFDKSLVSMVDSFKKHDADTSILLKEVDRPYQFGVVKFDENGKATKLAEKPKEFVSNYAIVGSYLFKSNIFNFIDRIKPSLRGELEISDAIDLQVKEGMNVQTTQLDSFWFDSGTREGLLDANQTHLIMNQKFDKLDTKTKNSLLLGNVMAMNNVEITDSNIMGPVYIGKNVKIRNSIIGPFTTLGDNCVVEDSEIQQSIIMDSTKVIKSKVYSSITYRELNIEREPLILNSLKK